MDSKTYIKETGVTDLEDYSDIRARMGDEFNARLTHYLLGVGTEAGELQDALKKHLIYGKELDRANLIEEIGDLSWYVARTLELLGSSFEEAMNKNIAKLRARYGDKFTEYAALNRDLDREREILEK
jgi:NTP pyrophosphatase (non-canonical NTP hydrolase)